MFHALKSRKSHCCLKLWTQWFSPRIFQKQFNHSWLINLRVKSAVKCDKKRGRRTDLSIKCHKRFVFDSIHTWEKRAINTQKVEMKSRNYKSLSRICRRKKLKHQDSFNLSSLLRNAQSIAFFAVMRRRLRRQNEGRYVDRFSLDKDLILLKKIFNDKIPVDTSRDWEMPFLIERYRRGLPSVNSMWIVRQNRLPLTNWRIHIDLIEVLGKMYCCVLRHERNKCCCFEFSCAAYSYFVRNLLFHPSNAIGQFAKNFTGWPWLE